MSNSKINRIFLALAAILVGTMLFSTVEALTVTLTSPTDESFTDDTTPEFTFEIADFTDNVTCDLLINGSDYGSKDITDNGSYTITANTDLNDGKYPWNIDCEGTSASQDWEVKVDTTEPIISLTSPSNEEVFSSEERRPDFTFTVEDNLDDEIDCELYIDDATEAGWSATVNSGDSETISLSEDLDWGEYSWYIQCVDEIGNTKKSTTRDLFMGGLIIKDIDIDEDKVKPGESVTIDVDIENIMDDLDVENVEVTIENDDLDIDEDDEIDEIKDGDEETISFTVEIDPESDEGDYTIDISVSGEDDDGYDHEAFGSIDLEVEREKHELLIESAYFSPSVVDCGQTTEITIDILNIGRNDEDDVYIIIKNSDLGIEELTDEFDIDKDDDQKESISITIPEDAEDKNYIFNVEVYYDDEDEKEVYIAQLNVNCEQPEYGADISLDTAALELKPGEEGEIQATLENTGDLRADYDLILTGASTWSEYSITPDGATLDVDETVNVIVHIMPESDADEGTRTLNLIVKHDGETLDSKTLKVYVEERDIDVEIISEGESGDSPLTGRAVFNAVGRENLAVIVAIIVVIVIVGASLTISRVKKN